MPCPTDLLNDRNKGTVMTVDTTYICIIVGFKSTYMFNQCLSRLKIWVQFLSLVIYTHDKFAIDLQCIVCYLSMYSTVKTDLPRYTLKGQKYFRTKIFPYTFHIKPLIFITFSWSHSLANFHEIFTFNNRIIRVYFFIFM